MSYNPYDAVYSGGSSYISKTNNTNKDPASNPSDWDLLASAGGQLRNYLAGLTVANGTDTVNDINIAVGECRSDDNAANIVIASPLVKQLDAAWVAGTNQGGRDTGAISDGTWHLFAIKNPTTGVCDVLFSKSLAAPTMPGGYTQKRRIGSAIRRTNIIAFKQTGDYFQITTPIRDINGYTIATVSGFVVPLLNVPVGLKFLADLGVQLVNSVGVTQITINDPDQTPAFSTHLTSTANSPRAWYQQIWTNSAASLRLTMDSGSGTCTYLIWTQGYFDYRGKQD